MVTWDRAIEVLILLAVLADILVWALDRKKQNQRDEKYLELQKQVVELLQDSNAELADIRDVTVDGEELADRFEDTSKLAQKNFENLSPRIERE